MNEKGLDVLSDLECINTTLLASLDPALRIQIQKKGVTVLQNLYSGFDTEYELSNCRKNLNKLVSVQIAVQTRTLIKLPLNSILDISYAHPLTSEITNLYQPKPVTLGNALKSETCGKELKEIYLINETLKSCVKLYREVKYHTFDLIIEALIEKLHGVEGITYYKDLKRDQIVFSLPLTPVKTAILYPENGYSMVELVKLGRSLTNKTFTKSFEALLKVFSEIEYSFDTVRLLN